METKLYEISDIQIEQFPRQEITNIHRTQLDIHIALKRFYWKIVNNLYNFYKSSQHQNNSCSNKVNIKNARVLLNNLELF